MTTQKQENLQSKINHITAEMITKSAVLNQLSGDPAFNKWQSQIKLNDDYTLSVIAGQYYMSIPKCHMPNFEQYVEYEAAILSKDGFIMFGEIFEDNTFSIHSFEEVWPYKTITEIVEMTNMVVDHINNLEVKNA